MADSVNEVARRWEDGVPHDPRAVAFTKALALIDRDRGSDHFDFRFGGDGDNGEELTYLLDVYFADLDEENPRQDLNQLHRKLANAKGALEELKRYDPMISTVMAGRLYRDKVHSVASSALSEEEKHDDCKTCKGAKVVDRNVRRVDYDADGPRVETCPKPPDGCGGTGREQDRVLGKDGP